MEFYGGEESGQPFYAAEYIQGITLGEFIKTKEIVPLDEAMLIFCKMVKALRVANQASIIHRDLKPKNIMLTRQGQVKVIDFGLGKDLDDEFEITESDTVFGTPDYCAPELLARGSRGLIGLDHRADIFAAALILYEMIMGELPIKFGEKADEVYFKKEDWANMPDEGKGATFPKIKDLPRIVRPLLRAMGRKDREKRISDYGKIERKAWGIIAKAA
jgi:serine/threonine-protein kinase